MCAIADLVTAGNETLAAAARPYARRVEILPTPIDLAPYSGPSLERSGTRLVWIGLPGNLPYLEILREPLARLSGEFPALSLKVLSERPPAALPIPVEFVRWSAESEARELAACDIGLMPLSDDDWTRGKGGFKLLQYMAARLPTVASPVGVNREIVAEGETGFLAADSSGWESVAPDSAPASRPRAGDGRGGAAARRGEIRTVDRFEAFSSSCIGSQLQFPAGLDTFFRP